MANLTIKSYGDMFFTSVVKCTERAGVFIIKFGTNDPRHVDVEMELSEVLVLYKGI